MGALNSSFSVWSISHKQVPLSLLSLIHSQSPFSLRWMRRLDRDGRPEFIFFGLVDISQAGSASSASIIDPFSIPFFTEMDAKDMQRLLTQATTADECRLIFNMFMKDPRL